MRKLLWGAARASAVCLVLGACGPAGTEEPSAALELTTATYTPMVESSTFQKRWASGDPSCFGVDDQYAWWMDAVRARDDAGFAAPCGPAEGPYADAPFAALVLHINREVIHHGAIEAFLANEIFQEGPHAGRMEAGDGNGGGRKETAN